MTYRIRKALPQDDAYILKSYKLQLVDSPLLTVFERMVLAVPREGEAKPFAAIPDAEKIDFRAFALGKISRKVDHIVRNSEVRVACAPDDDDVLMGCVVADPAMHALHFVMVKSVYRRFGIGAALVAEFPTCKLATTWTRSAEELGAKFGMVYAPSLVWPDPVIAMRRRNNQPREVAT